MTGSALPHALLLLALAIPSTAQERNVVLFVTDDLSPDAGCYGNPVVKTPHIDRLAGEGTRFLNAFCTTASCSASRSVILSGLHNHANGQYGHTHAHHKFSSYEDVRSLPVRLAEAGYRTARVGKYHVAPEHVYHFETVLPGSSRNPVEMAEACREVIEAASDQPFFLLFATSDPHRGGGFATELPHAPDRFGNLPDGRAREGIEPVRYDPRDVIVPGFLPDTPVCRAELAQYYQAVSRVDQGLGRLIEVLAQAGEWDRTLFLFLSDHGIAMPGAKTTVYDAGLRSPLLVRDPYVEHAGTVSRAMISWVDLTPTMLDFAGVAPTGTHGRSFLGILGEPDPEGWDEVFASHTFHEIQMYYPMRAVRERRFKLIWNIAHPLPFPFATDLWAAPTWQAQYAQGPTTPFGERTVASYIHRPRFELYDMEHDPNEARNLAGDPAHAETLERLQRELRDFQRRTDDPWISKWTYE